MVLHPLSLSLFPPPLGTWQDSLVLDSSFLTCLTVLMPTPASENDASCERDVALPISFGTAMGSTHGFFLQQVLLLLFSPRAS